MKTRIWGRPQVDLFATRDNALLPKFVSPCPDPLAVGMDAFSLDWNRWRSIYLFPPMPCLHQVLRLLVDFRGSGFLIAPLWEGADWFPSLQERCPVRMPLPRGYTLSQFTSGGQVSG